MRKLTLVAVAVLTTAVPSLVVAAPVQAKPPRPRAELVVKGQVTATLSDGKVTIKVSVKNKGSLKAAASTAAFTLSTDAVASSTDLALGTAPIGKIKPKKSKVASGVFTVPTTMPAGVYRVIACADSGKVVKERKETNNCKAASGSVTVGPSTPTAPFTVSATAGVGGTVATSDVTGGVTCAVTTCTFQPPGTGAVSFTPTPTATYRFGAWTGPTCTGYTTSAGNKITFTNPTGAKACTATFVKQVKVLFSQPVGGVAGTVTGSAPGGSCVQPNGVTGLGGSCTVDATTGIVLLQASNLLLHFSTWGGDCTGNANPLVLTGLTADKTCTANFVP